MLAAETDKGGNIKALVKHAGGDVATKPPNKVSEVESAEWLCIAKVAPGLSFHSRTMLADSITRQSLDKKHDVLFMS